MKHHQNGLERFNVTEGYSGALARAKRAGSGAPGERKFGKLSNRENLVTPPVHTLYVSRCQMSQ